MSKRTAKGHGCKKAGLIKREGMLRKRPNRMGEGLEEDEIYRERNLILEEGCPEKWVYRG